MTEASFKEKAGKLIAVLLLNVVFTLLLLEGGSRIYYSIRTLPIYRSPYHQTFVTDSKLGWAVKPDFKGQWSLTGYGDINYSSGEYGFREYGDINTLKPKVLVIGDSYTQAVQVSDGKAYYDALKQLGFEVFAYGGTGYGTLQQYYVLDQHFDRIKPDLILWQFCTNDFIDNDPVLAEKSVYQRTNFGFATPFYVDGKIRYIDTSRTDLTEYSYFLRLVSNVFQKVSSRLHQESKTQAGVEAELTEQHQLFKRTTGTTELLLGWVRKRVGKTPVVAFASDPQQIDWQVDVLSRLATKQGFYFIPKVQDTLDAAEESGTQVDGKIDFHWNDQGHAMVGKLIADYLTKQGLVSAVRQP